VLQLTSVKPGRQRQDFVLCTTSTTQLAPFLQRFRSDSEQEVDVVVSSAVVSPGIVDSVGDVDAVVITAIFAAVIIIIITSSYVMLYNYRDVRYILNLPKSLKSM